MENYTIISFESVETDKEIGQNCEGAGCNLAIGGTACSENCAGVTCNIFGGGSPD